MVRRPLAVVGGDPAPQLKWAARRRPDGRRSVALVGDRAVRAGKYTEDQVLGERAFSYSSPHS